MGRVKTQRTKTDVECSHTAISQATSHSMHHSRADTRKCSTERGDKNYEKTIQMTSMEEWDRTTQFFYIILFFFFTLFIQERVTSNGTSQVWSGGTWSKGSSSG